MWEKLTLSILQKGSTKVLIFHGGTISGSIKCGQVLKWFTKNRSGAKTYLINLTSNLANFVTKFLWKQLHCNSTLLQVFPHRNFTITFFWANISKQYRRQCQSQYEPVFQNNFESINSFLKKHLLLFYVYCFQLVTVCR